VACVFAVFALITDCVEEKLAAKCTKYDLIELSLDKLVSIHLVDLVLAGTNGSLTTETSRAVQSTLANVLLD
jgi:hypothetical protein